METLTKDVSSEQTFKLSNRLDLMVAPHSFLCRNGWGTKTGARQWSITIVDSAGRSERGAAVHCIRDGGAVVRCLSMLYSVVTLNIQKYTTVYEVPFLDAGALRGSMYVCIVRVHGSRIVRRHWSFGGRGVYTVKLIVSTTVRNSMSALLLLLFCFQSKAGSAIMLPACSCFSFT